MKILDATLKEILFGIPLVEATTVIAVAIVHGKGKILIVKMTY